jgi:hypothetical protein
VTTGPFAGVGDPAFRSIGLSLLGLVPATPDGAAPAAALLATVGIRLQLRRIEGSSCQARTAPHG